MNHLDLIKQLDNKLNYERFEIIADQIERLGVGYRQHKYRTGTNLIVDLGNGKSRIGVSSHFDRTQDSAGANDNGSSIAVCLDIIKKFRAYGNSNLGIRIFFFDEEETGLKGSTAYIKDKGIKDLSGLINMELVGMGDKFAIWPVDTTAGGQLLKAFETITRTKKIETVRADNIVTNTSDHQPFRKAGLVDSFTITCISDRDIETMKHYFRAMEFDVDRETLVDILSQAPIFHHYHKPTDTYEKLNENSIRMTSDAVWTTIIMQQGVSDDAETMDDLYE